MRYCLRSFREYQVHRPAPPVTGSGQPVVGRRERAAYIRAVFWEMPSRGAAAPPRLRAGPVAGKLRAVYLPHPGRAGPRRPGQPATGQFYALVEVTIGHRFRMNKAMVDVLTEAGIPMLPPRHPA